MSAKPRNKVLILGLDGATWDLLDGWASQGLLPTIERLRSRGAWGPLRSTIPPVTPSSWTSMYTGVNPGKHNIFGFFHRQPGSYRLAPVHASARQAKTLFRILSDAGLKVGVLNAPSTYPPEEINGLLVPGIPMPDEEADYTYPRELAAELHAVTGGKHRYPPGLDQATADIDRFFAVCDDYTKAVSQAARFMMNRLVDWNLFFVQFQVTDTVQHYFWHYLDPEHPRYEANAPEKVRNAVLDRYKVVDQHLGEIIDSAGEQADVLLVSDHGASSFYEQVYLNVWLWQRGWLKFKRSPTTMLRRSLYALGLTPEFIARRIYARAPKFARKSVGARGTKSLAIAERFFLSLSDVDWSRTRAYSYGTPLVAVYINLKGREPQGCVPEEEYEPTIAQLEELLREMRHPQTDEPIVDTIIRSSDAYQGPFAKRGPDLQILTRKMRYHGTAFLQFQSKDWLGSHWNRWSGHHTLDGIFLAAGPHTRTGTRVDGGRILDVAPTTLALLGQPIPDWMDGQVILDALDETFLEQNPPTIVHSRISGDDREVGAYSADEEAQIAKRLADLGYIE